MSVVAGALVLSGCNLGTHAGTNLGSIGFGSVAVDDVHRAVSLGKGGRLATGLDHGYVTSDINIDPLGTPEALHIASTVLSNGAANVLPHGVALSAAGDLLVAVSSDDPYSGNIMMTTWGVPS